MLRCGCLAPAKDTRRDDDVVLVRRSHTVLAAAAQLRAPTGRELTRVAVALLTSVSPAYVAEHARSDACSAVRLASRAAARRRFDA